MQKIVDRTGIKKLKEIEQILANEPLLKIQGIKKNYFSGKSSYDTLDKIISLVITRSTYEEGGRKLQCSPNRRRSQGDLYRIMKYYYPDITFGEFRKLLAQLLTEDKLGTFVCCTINKRVFFRYYPGDIRPKTFDEDTHTKQINRCGEDELPTKFCYSNK